MSKPRETWWGYVKNVIRRYPLWERELMEIHSQTITTQFSKGGGRGGAGRKTETTALRSLPPKDQERHDAVAKAVQKTRRLCDGELRCRLIDLTMMTGRWTTEGAAQALNVSTRTALRWRKDFVYLVADYLNLR